MELVSNLYPVIPADRLDLELTYSKPKLSKTDVETIIQIWIDKKAQDWSSDISVSYMCSNLHLVLLPLWILSGDASASWSASIGQDYYELKSCYKCSGKGLVKQSENNPFGNSDIIERCHVCGGSGKEQVKKTRFVSQTGYVNAELNGRVVENLPSDVTPPRLKKRDLNAVEEKLDKPLAAQFYSLQPASVLSSDGRKKSEDILRETLTQNANDIARDMGPVRNLQIVNIQIQNLSARLWGYPLLVGSFTYKDEEQLAIEIDALTGEIYVDVPKSVKSSRLRTLLYKIVLLLIVVLVPIIVFYTIVKYY